MTNRPTPAEIENNLRRELAMILDRPEEEIAADTPLAELGLDSIRLMEIIIFVEKEYNLNLVDLGLTREALQSTAALARVISESAPA